MDWLRIILIGTLALAAAAGLRDYKRQEDGFAAVIVTCISLIGIGLEVSVLL